MVENVEMSRISDEPGIQNHSRRVRRPLVFENLSPIIELHPVLFWKAFIECIQSECAQQPGPSLLTFKPSGPFQTLVKRLSTPRYQRG